MTSGNGEISPVAGALGGAGLGALAGRLIAGKHDNSEAMLGGALIGGLGGLIGSQAYERAQDAGEEPSGDPSRTGLGAEPGGHSRRPRTSSSRARASMTSRGQAQG